MVNSGEKWRKVANIGEKLEKVGGNGKSAKSGEK